MIEGTVKESAEKEYRKLDRFSFSALKDFQANRNKFYKKYVLKQKTEDLDETESLMLGDLLDGLLTLSDEDFQDKFETINIIRGSGQLWDLGDNLIKLTDGTVSFKTAFEEAFKQTKFNNKGEEVAFKSKTKEKILTMFLDSDAFLLYQEKMTKRDKKIVTIEELSKAEKIKQILFTTPWTADILSKDLIYQKQFNYEYKGLEFKSMIDFCFLDHKEKTIQPFDLKCSWLAVNFDYYFKKKLYYLQAALYDIALQELAKEFEYKLLPMKFMVADSTLKSKPIIWEVTPKDLELAKKGFGWYKGLDQIIEELTWCIENNEWGTPKFVIDNNGCIKINLEEDGVGVSEL